MCPGPDVCTHPSWTCWYHSQHIYCDCDFIFFFLHTDLQFSPPTTRHHPSCCLIAKLHSNQPRQSLYSSLTKQSLYFPTVILCITTVARLTLYTVLHSNKVIYCNNIYNNKLNMFIENVYDIKTEHMFITLNESVCFNYTIPQPLTFLCTQLVSKSFIR